MDIKFVVLDQDVHVSELDSIVAFSTLADAEEHIFSLCEEDAWLEMLFDVHEQECFSSLEEWFDEMRRCMSHNNHRNEYYPWHVHEWRSLNGYILNRDTYIIKEIVIV